VIPLRFVVSAGVALAVTLSSSGVRAQSSVSSAGADAEVVRALLQRIEQLERREAARTNTAPPEIVERLQRRIAELEQKVGAIEGGAKVLPEIAVTPVEGPTPVELDRKVRALEQRQSADAEAAKARAATAPKFTAGATGLKFTSADTNFVFGIKGMVQADSLTYFGDNPLNEGNDTFGIRRVRIVAKGTVYRDIDFDIVPQWGGVNDHGSNLQDASITYRLGNSFEIQGGKFKGPVGLEVLQSINAVSFNERSMVSGLVPLRSVGVQLSGKFLDGVLKVSGGVFNNAGDGRNPGNFDYTDGKEFAGRVFVEPFRKTELKWFKGLGLGVGGSYAQVSSNALGLPAVIGQPLPGYYTSPGTQQFFAYNPLVGPVVADGAHWRVSPQGWWYAGPFGVLGEYVISNQGVYNSSTLRSSRLEHAAWQVSGQWMLTGEAAGFGAVDPKRPFTLGSPGWGAWQLVGRVSRFDIDDNAFPAFANPDLSATDAASWSVGLNWWLNRNLRVLVSFTRTSFTGGGAPVNLAAPGTLIAPATVTAQDENLLTTRMQLSF
jgi:phosphate-selective porin OprO/OprP